MATDPKTGNIINDDKSFESIRADRSAELSNPGDEGPKIPKDLASVTQSGQNPIPEVETKASVEAGNAKQTDSQKAQQEAQKKEENNG